MIMKSMIKIYEALLNRSEPVRNKLEIAKIIEEFKNKFRVRLNPADAMKYLSRHNYIKRIFQGYYYINSPDERDGKYCRYEEKELLFMVLNKLKIQWYVGLNSALYLTGKFWQVPVTLHIINSRFSGVKKILSLNVHFFKAKDGLFFELKTNRTKNSAVYRYSAPAKTYIDMVYFRRTKKLIRNNQTKKELQYYPKWVGAK